MKNTIFILSILLPLFANAEAKSPAANQQKELVQIKIQTRLDWECDTHACGAERHAEIETMEKVNSACKALLSSENIKVVVRKAEFIQHHTPTPDDSGYVDAVNVDLLADCVLGK